MPTARDESTHDLRSGDHGSETHGTLTRYWDRRRYIRVPASGPARWLSGTQAGHCDLLDVSPGGAGLRLSARKAKQLGPLITLEIELKPGLRWCMARDARIVRLTPAEDGQCLVGLEFAPQGWES